MSRESGYCREAALSGFGLVFAEQFHFGKVESVLCRGCARWLQAAFVVFVVFCQVSDKMRVILVWRFR